MIRMLAALVVTVGGLVAASLWLDGIGAPRRSGAPLEVVSQLLSVPPSDLPDSPEDMEPSAARALGESLMRAVEDVAEDVVEGVERAAEAAAPRVPERTGIVVYEPSGRYEAPPLHTDAAVTPRSGDRAGAPEHETAGAGASLDSPDAPHGEAGVWRFAEDDSQGSTGGAGFARQSDEQRPEEPVSAAVSLDDRSRLIRRLLEVYARIENAP